MLTKLLILTATLSVASAACPNSCSGHGTCGAQEVCTCYDNWGMGGQPGGDCSDRLCPFELAWVDSPSVGGLTHQYAECSAKGICDRQTGECECVAGFTGKACARQVCPDDCSGHGTCEFMDELSYAFIQNDHTIFFPDSTPTWDTTYSGASGLGQREGLNLPWDSQRARACVCDATWTGINCASRMCPYGNDALATRSDTSDTRLYQVQTIFLAAGSLNQKGDYNTPGVTGEADGALSLREGFEGKSFAVQFTSKINETFTTIPIMVPTPWDTGSALADNVESALENLPNRVIDSVEVSTHAIRQPTQGIGIEIRVTFDGESVHGRQNILEVLADPCADGCTPQITGFDNLVSSTNHSSFVSQTTAADYNSYECGRRGKCDYDTGICACFEGFTGEACTTITALV